MRGVGTTSWFLEPISTYSQNIGNQFPPLMMYSTHGSEDAEFLRGNIPQVGSIELHGVGDALVDLKHWKDRYRRPCRCLYILFAAMLVSTGVRRIGEEPWIAASRNEVQEENARL